MKAIELDVSQQARPEGVRRTMRLRNVGPSSAGEIEIYFDLLGDQEAPFPELLDGFVIGVILLAMANGRPLRVHGALSATVCRNLAEFQSAWAIWEPQRYRRIELIPDAVVDVSSVGQAQRAISAMSGGVDGVFTAVRHARKWLGNGSYPLTDAVLIHGFDVTLEQAEAYVRLADRVRPLVERLGLRLRLMRTNLKPITGQHWEHSHGTAIAACLHNYSHSHSTALIGGGVSYAQLVYPWGSTPATDYLLSGDQMRLVLDGSGFSRTEKVAALRDEPGALSKLKVCWQGSQPERNCGHCEKCVRTKLNLLAARVERCEAFDEPLDLKDVERLRPTNEFQYIEMSSLCEYAQKHGVTEEWVGILKRRVSRYERRKLLGAILAAVRRR